MSQLNTAPKTTNTAPKTIKANNEYIVILKREIKNADKNTDVQPLFNRIKMYEKNIATLRNKAPKSKTPKSKAQKGRKITKNENIIIDKLASISTNKVTIKKLQDENKASYELILPLMRTEIKTLKNSNKAFKAMTKKELIVIIDKRYDSSDKLVKNVLTCLFENLTIDKKIPVTLFNDTIKFLESELISKTQINNSTLEQLELKIKAIRHQLAIEKAKEFLGV